MIDIILTDSGSQMLQKQLVSCSAGVARREQASVLAWWKFKPVNGGAWVIASTSLAEMRRRMVEYIPRREVDMSDPESVVVDEVKKRAIGGKVRTDTDKAQASKRVRCHGSRDHSKIPKHGCSIVTRSS